MGQNVRPARACVEESDDSHEQREHAWRAWRAGRAGRRGPARRHRVRWNILPHSHGIACWRTASAGIAWVTALAIVVIARCLARGPA